jgi:phosphoglycolate phosphatase-like HAD superfamily hydrolase
MKIIIFDFDGTIADTFALTIDIAHKLTGHESLLNPKIIIELKRDSLVKVAKKLKIPKYKWPFLIYKGRKEMGLRLNEIKTFEGINNVLAELHQRGYTMYIMSTNSNKNISSFLSTHGLSSYFNNVYGNIGLFNKARALRKIIVKNKMQPEDIIYVGDEIRDIEAAKSVNVPVVAVSWGYNDPELLAKKAPTVVVHNSNQLFKVLISWEIS